MKSSIRSLKKKRIYYPLIILFISILIAGLVYFETARQIRNKIVSEYIDAKTLALTGEFADRTQRLENSIRLFSRWGENGLINLNDTASFERAFIPVLADAKNIYAVTIIENNGNEYQIVKKDSFYLSSFYFPDKQSLSEKIINQTGELIKSTHRSQTKSFAEKYWLNHYSADTAYQWHGPYVSDMFNKEIISISSSWVNKDSTVIHIAIHILLNDIFKAFSDVSLDKNEYLFLLNDYGDIYNVLNYEKFAQNHSFSNSLLYPYYRINLPQISKAVEVWMKQNKDTTATIEFKIKHKNYWAKFTPVKHSKYLLGIVVSENSINSKIGESNIQIILFSALIILLGTFAGFILMIRANKKLREYRQPQIRKNHEAEDIARLAQMQESRTLEFKSTIRFNLHTGKNDKAIEFAWMKSVAAFLNTDGGTILIGIQDDGSFHGIEKDGFENTDKALLHIKNLISKNIGIEFMKFITMFTGNIDDKTVVALVCKQAAKPAYIKNGGEEQFYVRVGPSSAKLSVSQAVEHIFTHGYKRITSVK